MRKLERNIETWRRMSPKVVCEGSHAQMFYCIHDAQKDILALAEALSDAQAALAMMIAPDAIDTTTVVTAFTAATAAEAKARAALSQARA